MSLWEFNATIKMFLKIKSGKGEPMTQEAYEDGLDKLRALGLKDMKI